ncbi:MAG: hypothetical protein WC955_05615 [Elusimicrobiota bacterium]
MLTAIPLLFSITSENSAVTQNIVEIKAAGGFYIDVSSLTPFLTTLPIDEQTEQLHDWAMVGLLTRLDIDNDKYSDILHAKFPLRLSYLENVTPFTVLPGRVETITPGTWVLALPMKDVYNNTALCSVVDHKRVETLVIPSTIHVFGYVVNPDSTTLQVVHISAIKGSALFSPEYGYYESKVDSLESFTRWFNKIDDLTYADWASGLTLGGRKRAVPLDRGITMEDVAALYHAYKSQAGSNTEKETARKKEYDKYIQQKYNETLTKTPGLKQQIIEGKTTATQIYKELRKKIPYAPIYTDTNVGFSLDPEKDTRGLAAELDRLAVYDPGLGFTEDPGIKSYVLSRSAQLKNTSQKLRDKNYAPFLELRRGLAGSNDTNAKVFDEMLKHLDQKSSYQTARYDGDLKGTEVGMILFYTDLNAKIWALNYGNTLPRQGVTGIRAMSDIRVPKHYWNEFLKLSNTRLWFGLKSDNFMITGGNRLYFAPTVTRVYAASSDPLYPGKESEPNYQSSEFLGWWDRHYSAVADYEPQYYKLDQIQKWSAVCMVLQEVNVDVLNFFSQVKPVHNNVFNEWYTRNINNFRSRVELPFIDSKKFGKPNECLGLMYSEPYPLMGLRFYISGGVSLAARKDITSKLKGTETKVYTKSSGTKPLSSSTGKNRGTSSGGTGDGDKVLVKEQRNVKYEFPKPAPEKMLNEARWKVVPKKEIKLRAPVLELPQGVTHEAVLKSQKHEKLEINYKFNNTSYGRFSVKSVNPKKVAFGWLPGEGYIINSILGNVVAQETIMNTNGIAGGMEGILNTIPGINKVVVKDVNKKYYLQLSTGTSSIPAGTWVELTVNPGSITPIKGEYYARAAGTLPESNIYSARIVPATSVLLK